MTCEVFDKIAHDAGGMSILAASFLFARHHLLVSASFLSSRGEIAQLSPPGISKGQRASQLATCSVSGSISMEPVSCLASRVAPPRLLPHWLRASIEHKVQNQRSVLGVLISLPLRISTVSSYFRLRGSLSLRAAQPFFACAAAIGGYLSESSHCVMSDNFAFVEIGRISQLCFSRQSCFSSVRFCVYRPAI